MRSRVASAVLALSLAACSAGRSGLAGQDGGPGTDLGGDSFAPPDTGGADVPTPLDLGTDMPLPPVDMGIDMPLPPIDMGIDMPLPPVDMGIDTGPVCVAGCTPDGTSVVSCGSGAPVTTHCDRGCDAVARDCRGVVACSYTTDGMVTTGTMRIGLCGEGADRDRIMTTECFFSTSGGEDVVLRLEVDSPGHYVIDLADAPGGYGVDSVVYLRTICDMQSSQFACNDDATAATRDASLTVDLDPGEYFLVVDSIDDEPGGDGCGNVDLTVTRTP